METSTSATLCMGENDHCQKYKCVALVHSRRSDRYKESFRSKLETWPYLKKKKIKKETHLQMKNLRIKSKEKECANINSILLYLKIKDIFHQIRNIFINLTTSICCAT